MKAWLLGAVIAYATYTAIFFLLPKAGALIVLLAIAGLQIAKWGMASAERLLKFRPSLPRNRIVDIVRREKLDTAEVRWTILLFRGTRRTVGLVLRRSLDGEWTQNGKPYPYLVVSPKFINFRTGAWIFGILRRFITPATPSTQ